MPHGGGRRFCLGVIRPSYEQRAADQWSRVRKKSSPPGHARTAQPIHFDGRLLFRGATVRFARWQDDGRAEGLARFGADRPRQPRRESPAQRLRRWLRRGAVASSTYRRPGIRPTRTLHKHRSRSRTIPPSPAWRRPSGIRTPARPRRRPANRRATGALPVDRSSVVCGACDSCAGRP